MKLLFRSVVILDVSSTSYPRVDPIVIMGVISSNGNDILLGRGLSFPTGMYSCLSGYVEPGKSWFYICVASLQKNPLVGRNESDNRLK